MDGRLVVFTGGTSGIGHETALAARLRRESRRLTGLGEEAAA